MSRTIYEIIDSKIRGQTLGEDDIAYFVRGFCQGSILPEQASALCAAICINGMTETETAQLTFAMRDSGESLDLSGLGGTTADKHSTGGVGDTTTMIVVPILAAAGVYMAKMSGRSLGHTGGTLDKLESYEGYKVEQPPAAFREILKKTGGSIIGQSLNIAPADKLLYALRDRTGTVKSIPLIASSVMSKKLALGADIIVLDVKYGSGAFMKTANDAESLAQCMVDIGKRAGKKTAALITSMEQPLSDSIGSNLELNAAVRVLKGEKNDLEKVSLRLCQTILSLAGRDESLAGKMISDGSALKKFKEIIEAHGGKFEEELPVSGFETEVKAVNDGYIAAINTEEIGLINAGLGGGRMSNTDFLDHTVGIVMKKRLGDKVKKGEVVAVLYGKKGAEYAGRFLNSVKITGEFKVPSELIYKILY